MSRSLKKGPYCEASLMKKVEALDAANKNEVIKTWSRRSTIFPNFIGKTFAVHNGKDFVPVYVGCGGTEVDGLDYVLTNKIFRKFESLNLAFIRDEIDGLIEYLSTLFGEENMQEAKAYLRRLKKLV